MCLDIDFVKKRLPLNMLSPMFPWNCDSPSFKMFVVIATFVTLFLFQFGICYPAYSYLVWYACISLTFSLIKLIFLQDIMLIRCWDVVIRDAVLNNLNIKKIWIQMFSLLWKQVCLIRIANLCMCFNLTLYAYVFV